MKWTLPILSVVRPTSLSIQLGMVIPSEAQRSRGISVLRNGQRSLDKLGMTLGNAKTCWKHHRRSFYIYILSGIISSSVALADDAVPVAPLSPSVYRGWTNVYRLQNDYITVKVVPETGRMMHVSWRDEPNLLRVDETLAGGIPEFIDSTDWLNFGGDWIWPMAQDRWPTIQEREWPPSRLLDGRSWAGRAWRTDAGNEHALITQDYDDPLHIRVTRTIRLAVDEPGFRIRQQLERTGDSVKPVTLWQLAQIEAVDYVIVPVDDDSIHNEGYVLLNFDPLPEDGIQRCGTVMVFEPSAGTSHKFGSDSPRAWLAMLKGDTLLILRAVPGQGEGAYPDKGSTITVYSSVDANYVELETLSVEQVLAEGEYLDNTLYYSLHRLQDPPDDPCALAEQVQQLLGETTAIPSEPLP